MATTITYDVLFPTLVCPVCGKEFLRRKDWGCVVTVRGSEASCNASRVRLCSIPCMKKYEADLLEKDARHAETLRCCQSYKLHMIDGLPVEEVQKRLGHGRGEYVMVDCRNADVMYWQEIEWLNKHGWEVAV